MRHQLARGGAGLEQLHHARDELARRERLLDEEVLDPAVLVAAQEHDLRTVERAAGAAHLLVVRDHRAGRLVVDDEPEVRLVVAHAERAGGHDRLEVVAQQLLLDLDPAFALDLAAVGLGGDAPVRQPVGDDLRVALGERVHDPGARELRQVRREPGQPVGLAGQLHHLEAQARAAERAAVRLDGRAELLLDVGDHPIVGGRGRAEHRDTVGQPFDHLSEAPVIGPEVMPPVADAVRLVDDQQPDAIGEQRQHLGPERRVVEPLGADQQQVDRVVGQQLLDLVPRLAVGAVHRVRPEAKPLRGRDLVAHQRQQRRDDQRRPRALLAQERGGDEVHGRLAPARALDAQDARAVVDEVGDRFVLVGRGTAPQARRELSGAPAIALPLTLGPRADCSPPANCGIEGKGSRGVANESEPVVEETSSTPSRTSLQCRS